MNTIFWHDYETFGADPRCDRPAQFAGVRTDERLQPVGEPVNCYCQPAPDFLPHPEACLITGITPQIAWERGVIEAEFAARIHAELAMPGTCGAGYNSVRFDDEVTRHLLFRNLYDPYAREWQNGNSRWDIIDLARMTYALRPEGMAWPRNEDGTPSFRLEALSAANQLLHDAAHDALSDVYATIALARKIRQCQPKLYEFLFTLRDKKRAEAQFDLINRAPLLHTSRMFPAQFGHTTVVVPLARDPVNKNAIVVYDLRHDPAPWLQLPAEEIRRRVFTPAADLPPDTPRVALKTVHLNKCPALAPLRTLPADAPARLQLDLAQINAHLAQVHATPMPPLAAKIQQALAPQPFPPAPDVECQLYAGFIGNADRAHLEQARTLPPAALATCHPPFNDARLPELLFRYRARNYPHTLTPAETARWRGYCQRRLTDPQAGATVVADAFFQTLARLQHESADAAILAQLHDYGQKIVHGEWSAKP